jgi:hypothetical protein
MLRKLYLTPCLVVIIEESTELHVDFACRCYTLTQVKTTNISEFARLRTIPIKN